MSVKIEAGNGWLCTVIPEFGAAKQGMSEEFTQPFVIDSIRMMQLRQEAATVNMYFGIENIGIETISWAKGNKPNKESGIVIKWPTNHPLRTAVSKSIYYSIIGGPAVIEFGNPANMDYLKIVTDKA